MSIDNDPAEDRSRRTEGESVPGPRPMPRRTTPVAADHVPLCKELGINPAAPGAEFIVYIHDGDGPTTAAAYYGYQEVRRAIADGIVERDHDAIMDYLSKSVVPRAAHELVVKYVKQARLLDDSAVESASKASGLATDSMASTTMKLAVPGTRVADTERFPGITYAQNRDLLARNEAIAAQQATAGTHLKGPVPGTVITTGLTLLSGAESYLLLQRIANFSVQSPSSWVILGLLTGLLTFVTHWLTRMAGEAIAEHRELRDAARALTRAAIYGAPETTLWGDRHE